jgi:TonB family protein
MTLLLNVVVASTVIFAAALLVAAALATASADTRRLVWRATFASVAGLPIVMALVPPQTAFPFVAAAGGSVTTAAAGAAADYPWLFIAWAVGAAVVLARLAAGLLQVHRWGRRATREQDGNISPEIEVPATWGVVRPQILLPAAARTWSREQRALVMRHEAAHIESRDWAWQMAARLVTAALWCHPLAWLADRQLRREAERAADDRVLAGGADPIAYASGLVEMARTLSARSTNAAVVAMAEPSSLEDRVRRVLDGTVARRRASWRVRAGLIAGVSALSVAAAAMQEPPVYRVGDEGVTPPSVLEEVRPQYTQDALDRRIEGRVILQGIVTEDGVMSDIRVAVPLEPSLDREAVQAALRWRFAPAQKDGAAVRVRITLEMRFSLK